jgi:hypothetical protein
LSIVSFFQVVSPQRLFVEKLSYSYIWAWGGVASLRTPFPNRNAAMEMRVMACILTVVGENSRE